MALNSTKAPNLVIPTFDYNIGSEEQFRNQLRLYFNTLDAVTQGLLDPNGGAEISLPHISASYNSDQIADGDDTPTKVLWDTAESLDGFTLNVDNTATAQYTGVYKIDYSLQLANTENVALDTRVWLQVDTTDVPRSSSIFTLPARKSSGVYSFAVAYSSITFEITAGEKIALYWATEQRYVSGVQDGIFMENQAAITSPYTAPANPSAIGSITFVSRA